MKVSKRRQSHRRKLDDLEFMVCLQTPQFSSQRYFGSSNSIKADPELEKKLKKEFQTDKDLKYDVPEKHTEQKAVSKKGALPPTPALLFFCQALQEKNQECAREIKFMLDTGFNILVYGVGSKFAFLSDFARLCLHKQPCFYLNGYHSGLNLK